MRTGGYYAYCPELKGVRVAADTFEQTRSNIEMLVKLSLEELYAYEKDELRECEGIFCEVMVVE
jgi:predicted RNase H-like HicB family nuclease